MGKSARVMAPPVDTERLMEVFGAYAFDINSHETETSHAGVACDVDEPYIPLCLLAAAVRASGLYPTASMIYRFVESVPGAAAGAVTFAMFLQLCECVVSVSQPTRSDILKMVEDVDIHGSGMMSHRDLFLLLTNGSAAISDSEVHAILELLDPSMCGLVQLKDLATILLGACVQCDSASCELSKGNRLTRQRMVDPKEVTSRRRCAVGMDQPSGTSSAGDSDPSSCAFLSQQRSDESARQAQRYVLATSKGSRNEKMQKETKLATSTRLTAVDSLTKSTTKPSANKRALAQGSQCASKSSRRVKLGSTKSSPSENSLSHKYSGVASDAEVAFLPSESAARQETYGKMLTARTVDVDVQSSTYRVAAMPSSWLIQTSSQVRASCGAPGGGASAYAPSTFSHSADQAAAPVQQSQRRILDNDDIRQEVNHSKGSTTFHEDIYGDKVPFHSEADASTPLAQGLPAAGESLRTKATIPALDQPGKPNNGTKCCTLM